MKKCFAVLLALCLALAALPVLAEEDASGEWYGVAAGITFATMNLNADNSVSAVFSGEESLGTWTREGDTVTVILDGDAVDFTLTGSAMTSPLLPYYVFLKTPGMVTMEQVEAYMNDGTLPEGIDEATMQGCLTNLVALREAQQAAEQPPETPAETPTEAPAPEGGDTPAAEDLPGAVTVAETFCVREQYGSPKAFWIAKVQNPSEVKLYLTDASMVLKNEAGEEIGKATFFYPSGSKFLEPGEETFVGMTAEVAEGAEVAVHEAVYSGGQPGFMATEDIRLEVTGYEPALEGGGAFDEAGAWITVKNTLDEAVSGIQMIAAFEDEEGKPWSLQTFNIYADKLGAGSTYAFWVGLNKDVKEYCDTNGIKLTQVEAFAWKELN